MKEQEYNDRLERLKKEFENNKKALIIEYAVSNNPYKVGDIIEDHISKGEIISWQAHKSYMKKLPSLVYKCKNLTKLGSVSKREPQRNIYQYQIE